MAAKLTLVKKIVNEEVINSFALTLNILFGGKLPVLYDETKTYAKGDVVLVLEDGVYKFYCFTEDINNPEPFDKSKAKEIIILDLFKDSSILTQNNKDLLTKNEALADDVSTLLFELAGMIDSRLCMKTLYRENFKKSDHLDITTGLHIPGCIKSISGQGIDFKLIKPVELTIKPTSFKIKHFIELLGTPNIGCSITFNALDPEPYWFNANDSIISSDFFAIDESLFVKDQSLPYAMDIRIFGNCDSTSSITISDLMVVFI